MYVILSVPDHRGFGLDLPAAANPSGPRLRIWIQHRSGITETLSLPAGVHSLDLWALISAQDITDGIAARFTLTILPELDREDRIPSPEGNPPTVEELLAEPCRVDLGELTGAISVDGIWKAAPTTFVPAYIHGLFTPDASTIVIGLCRCRGRGYEWVGSDIFLESRDGGVSWRQIASLEDEWDLMAISPGSPPGETTRLLLRRYVDWKPVYEIWPSGEGIERPGVPDGHNYRWSDGLVELSDGRIAWHVVDSSWRTEDGVALDFPPGHQPSKGYPPVPLAGRPGELLWPISYSEWYDRVGRTCILGDRPTERRNTFIG